MAGKPTYEDLEHKVKELEQAQRDCVRLNSIAQEHRRLVEAMEKIDQAIQSSDSLERMLDTVIEVVLEAFTCDRAWLFHPCNPDASSFSVTVESTTAEYPGAKALGVQVPMTDDMADYCHRVLASPGQVVIDPPDGEEMNNDIAIKFSVKTLMLMALHPKIGDTWMFGLHQCDHRREWSEEDKKLFRRIGFRITDALSNKLYLQQLKESEKKYRSFFESGSDAYFLLEETTFRIMDANTAAQRLYGYTLEEFKKLRATDLSAEPEKTSEAIREFSEEDMGSKKTAVRFHKKKDGTVFPAEITANRLWIEGQQMNISAVRDITDRKRAERAVRESEEKYRRLAENSPAIVYQFLMTSTGEFEFPYISEAIFDMVGVSAEDVIRDSSRLIGIIHPDDKEIARKGILQSANTLEPYHTVFRYIKDGAARWVECRSTPETKEDGSILWDGFLVDITERKQAEEELKASEANLRSIFEAARNVAFVKTDVDSESPKITQFSPGAEEIFGYKAEEVIGRPVEMLHLEEDVERFPEVMERMQKGENGFQGQSMLVRKSGERFPAVFSTCPVFNDEREMVATIGISVDITELKRAEAALAENEERLNLALDSVSDGVWDWRVDTGDVYFSSRWYTMLGYEPCEFPMEFETWRQLVHPEDLPGAEEIIFRHLETAEPFEVEFRMRTKDGEWRDILGRGKSVAKDSAGKAVRMLGTHVDITERKRLESHLRQGQKMESIGTLAGGIAHDFNNALTPIMVQTELGKLAIPRDNPVQGSLDEILKAAHRAKDLIKQILTFSRQSEQQRVPLDLAPLIKENLKLLRSSIPTTIEIRQNIAVGNCVVMADPTQMQQIVMNLCTNASQAMQEMGSFMEVGLEAVELNEDEAKGYPNIEAGRYVMLTVSDRGTGIEPELMEKIFDPFFTTKPINEGTGMGLSVVHGIVRSHGGDITVRSTPGKGSTFTVVLPRLEQDAGEEAKPRDESVPHGSERILFVDDEAPMAKVGEQMLTRLGYQVDSKMSAVEALAAFRDQPDRYDLVMTDMTMPNMTGDNLSKALLKVRPDIPIIICTGFSHQIDEEKALNMGIRAFVMKPFVLKDIAETIRKVLDSDIKNG